MTDGWDEWEREIREEPPLLVVPDDSMLSWTDGAPPKWALALWLLVVVPLFVYDLILLAR